MDWQPIVFTAEQRADPQVSGEGADLDGDDLSNEQERLAGTHPLDSGSTLRLVPLEAGAARFTLRAVAGRSYTVECSDPALPWQWTVLRHIPIGTIDRDVVVEDDSSPVPASRLYRIVTPASP